MDAWPRARVNPSASTALFMGGRPSPIAPQQCPGGPGDPVLESLPAAEGFTRGRRAGLPVFFQVSAPGPEGSCRPPDPPIPRNMGPAGMKQGRQVIDSDPSQPRVVVPPAMQAHAPHRFGLRTANSSFGSPSQAGSLRPAHSVCRLFWEWLSTNEPSRPLKTGNHPDDQDARASTFSTRTAWKCVVDTMDIAPGN